jgi:hypothetical protein
MINSQYFNLLSFRLKIYESSGNSFQKLFSDIMILRNPEFRRIHPYGNSGDGGNDGYIPLEKRYYQVYGPEYSGVINNAAVYAKNKLKDDFEKICNNWEKPACYHFVYNDYFRGAPKNLIDALGDLKTQHCLSESSILTADNLLNYFLELNDDKRALIVAAFPFSDVPFSEEIDSNGIAQLIRNIAQRYNPIAFLNDHSEAPDFDKKILMNGLGKPIHDALRHYSHFINLADDFLNTQPGLGQVLAFEMQKLYAESVEGFASDIEDCADLRFLWIVEKLLTEDIKSAHGELAQLQAQRTASLVIMAKYFESCDIYEHPERFTAS